jgi:hypothetical protein
MSLIPGIHVTPLKTSPRIGRRFVAIAAVAMACFAASASNATDVRGRVEAKSTGALTVELRSIKPPHAPIRIAVTDRDGRYYLPDVAPGRYELVVKGLAFPVAVEQMAIQELPPIQLKS